MNCPMCGTECERVRVGENVYHNRCPDCTGDRQGLGERIAEWIGGAV